MKWRCNRNCLPMFVNICFAPSLFFHCLLVHFVRFFQSVFCHLCICAVVSQFRSQLYSLLRPEFDSQTFNSYTSHKFLIRNELIKYKFQNNSNDHKWFHEHFVWVLSMNGRRGRDSGSGTCLNWNSLAEVLKKLWKFCVWIAFWLWVKEWEMNFVKRLIHVLIVIQ